MAQSDRMILAAVFISGTCSLLVEIAGARVLAPYLGTSIYSWAAVIGFVLAALSIGYYSGGVMADRQGNGKQLSIVLLAAGLMTMIVPFLGAALLPFTLFMDIIPASLLGAVILVPASYFYGMVSPYAIKLTSKSGAEGKGAGMVFSVSTIGSIAGALGTGFVLIPNMAITHIFISAGAFMLLASLLVSGFRKGALLDVFAFAILASVIALASPAPQLRGTSVFSGDSAYYHVQVLDMDYNGGPARILFLDNAASSGERADGTPAFDYTMTSRLGYEIIPDPKSALVVGSAAGTEVEELKMFYPSVHVTGVEIDPMAVEMGRKYFSLKEDDRTEIVIDDARRFLLRTEGKYDLVLVDTFRGLSMPYHLTTKEYLAALKGRMAPGGVVIANLISAPEGEKAAVFRYLHSTFSSEFENVIALPTKDDMHSTQNIVLIASDRSLEDFSKAHAALIYDGDIPAAPPLTDERNPIELYLLR
ncbi:fused MFS/spermidine synthase [Candidatus Micrarchaeota archaeon]|nr:fused MFS/spermidine synthase [Candidatus Micrarchaeota archaeon]